MVMLLHAGVADCRMWDEHLVPLAEAGFRAVAVDLPGFGDEPLPDREYAPWDDVLQMMDELSVQRAALVGNSLGGDVALRVAAVAPARVTALVLCSAQAPGIQPSAELEAAWRAENAALERGDIDAAVEAVLDAWTLSDAPPALRERVGVMQRRVFEIDAEHGDLDEAPDPVEADPGILERLAAPVLVVAGARDKPDFRDGADVLASALPRARRETISEAGHLPPLETPDAFCELVVTFLREVHEAPLDADGRERTPG